MISVMSLERNHCDQCDVSGETSYCDSIDVQHITLSQYFSPAHHTITVFPSKTSHYHSISVQHITVSQYVSGEKSL